MPEYVLVGTKLNGEVEATVYANIATNLPARVEVTGVSGHYRFFITSPDRVYNYTLVFDSPTTISRNINNAIASKYKPNWVIGVEGI
jgi:hypothetical protein